MLMLILLVLQFVPFWSYGDAGETASISSYLWFPTENKALESSLQETLADSHFSVDAIVLPSILMLLLAAIGLFFCLWKSTSKAVALLPIATGAVGLWDYLAEPVMKLGMGWGWHVAVCAVLILMGACALYAAQRQG